MIRSTIFIMHSSQDDKNYETHRISRYANDPTENAFGDKVILWTKRRTSRRTPWLEFVGIWQASLGLPGDPVSLHGLGLGADGDRALKILSTR
jgi:hypothetical protein